MEKQAHEHETKLRVLIASESAIGDANGVSNSVRQTAKYLKKHGHEAVIVSPKPSPNEIHGFEVIKTRSIPFQGFNLGIPGPRKLPNAIERFEPDVIHVASPAWTIGKTALLGAQLFDVPSVAIYQTDIVNYARRFKVNPLTAYTERLIAQLHNYATLNLAPSIAARQDLIRFGVDESTIHQWGRGVDSERFTPDLKQNLDVLALKDRLSDGGKRPVIGYVGRLALEKSVDRLAALKGLDANIVVVGDGAMRQQLEASLPNNTTFLGELRGKKLAQAYAALDIFVHTGTQETFGQTLQEAMASELPVVAPAIGGPLDIVKEEVTGLLYTPGSDESLRFNVQRLIENVDERKEMGRQGRLAIEHRTWDALGQELEAYYKMAITKKLDPFAVPEALKS